MAHISLLTPLGHLTVFAEDAAIVALDFGRAPGGEETPVLHEVKQQLDAYFDGRLHAFDIPLKPFGSHFQQTLWQALRAVPYGATVTYGDIGRQIGAPARAVGRGCGNNPIPIIIPCHRIVGAGGRLVGYSGGEGTATKQALLRLEGAVLL